MREWLDDASSSLARGEVHDENLAYLLGDGFVPEKAWEQALEAFAWLRARVARMESPLVVRAIVSLADSAELVAAPIAPESIASEARRGMNPPSLVVMPLSLAVDHGRRFEEYRVDLALDHIGEAAASYSVSRSLELPPEASWLRHVVLEAFD